jgi:AraC family transcriptional regulator
MRLPLQRPSPPLRTPASGELELFRSEVVSVLDWRCAGHDSTREELSQAHQVIVTRRGSFERSSGGTRTFADSSAVCFWNSDESYRVRHPVPGGDSCSVFQLSPDAVRELMAVHDPGALDRPEVRFPAASAPLDGVGYLQHRLALHAARRMGEIPLEVEELAVELLHRALAPLRGLVRQAPNKSAEEYAARVREVVAARYREPLSLADVARAVHCSPYHLSRMVSAVEGISIHRLILRLRLREALERMLDTGDTVAAIAMAVGFGSHSRFSEAFRREFGVTPREVRLLSGAAVRMLRLARRPDRSYRRRHRP